MKRTLLVTGLFITVVSYSQSLKDYIFPNGIKKTTFNYTKSDGTRDENATMIYEYLVDEEGATIFISNFQDNNVLSRRKEEYYVTDTAIYLININTQNILAYNRENFLGYKNCYLKLPTRDKMADWFYKETNSTSYKCSATLTHITISNVQYSAIKVDKTPFENGKYLENYKTSVYYIEGKGLYKEIPIAGKKPIYLLSATDFDISKKTINEPSPDPISKTDTIRIDIMKKGIVGYKADSYSDVTHKGKTVKLEKPTYFIFQEKKIYMVKDGVILKSWEVLKTTTDPDGDEKTTKEGDTLIIFGFVSIVNKKGEELAYDGNFCRIEEIEINPKYIKK
jgi:hypothetical protein